MLIVVAGTEYVLRELSSSSSLMWMDYSEKACAVERTLGKEYRTLGQALAPPPAQ